MRTEHISTIHESACMCEHCAYSTALTRPPPPASYTFRVETVLPKPPHLKSGLHQAHRSWLLLAPPTLTSDQPQQPEQQFRATSVSLHMKSQRASSCPEQFPKQSPEQNQPSHSWTPCNYTPLRTLQKTIFLISSWVLYKQQENRTIPKGDIGKGLEQVQTVTACGTKTGKPELY